ncbi:MAG TPA: FG-GAP-like repeat-containing protein, partial [Terriglobales bacterium]|nr:FG-GAP-like repeat-containing protein [Terriglobales bacterium]
GPVVVNVNGVPSNGAQFTVRQHLQITSLSQTSGAIGALITINGTGFGTTQGFSSVTFNGTSATPIGWSDSAIAVPVPTGATTGLLAVTVGGTTASASFTVVTGLVLSGLSPALATVGTSITITGSGFGAAQGSSTVKFNGVTATPTSWTSSSIVVPVPPGALAGPVTVTVAGIQSAGAMFVPVSSGGPYAYSLAAGNFGNTLSPGLAIVNRCLSTTNCSSGSVGIMLGNGNGTFKPAVTYSSGGIESLAATVGDFNNDGIQDLAVLNSCASSACTNGSVSVLLGKGDGTFRSPLNSSAGGYQSIGIAMGDFNGDYIPDLVIANNCADSSCASGGTVTVLIGKGDGTFKPPVSYASAGQGAFSIVVGDFNRDGIPDLAVVNNCASTGCSSGGTVGILLGKGDGTFKPAVTYSSGGQGAYSLATADFNNDGIADLAVVNNCANSTCSNGGAVGVLLGNGDGTFQAPIVSSSGGLFAYSLAIADFNQDWHPDLAVSNEYGGTSNGGTLSVLLGNGDGTFQAAANYDSDGTNPFSVVAADFHIFGSTDLAVANSCLPAFNCAEGAITILSGNGDGTFGSPASYAALPAGSQSGTLAPPHHQVSLSWDAVVSVNGYNVYRGSQSGGPYTKINPIVDASPSFIDLSVVAGQTYYYVTTAVNAEIESGYSNEVEASIPSP